MGKPVRFLLSVAVLSVSWASPSFPHGGGLDAKGGHYNRKTGEYHCHRCDNGAVSTQRPANTQASKESYIGFVVGVSDGDTIELLTSDKRSLKIRLANIDAPEKGQPFGQRAKQELSDLIYRLTVTVKVKDTDRYGRIVGQILYDGPGVEGSGKADISAVMVSKGMAWVYEQYNDDPSLTMIEAQARAEKRGLWADTDPTPPWHWRKR